MHIFCFNEHKLYVSKPQVVAYLSRDDAKLRKELLFMLAYLGQDYFVAQRKGFIAQSMGQKHLVNKDSNKTLEQQLFGF